MKDKLSLIFSQSLDINFLCRGECLFKYSPRIGFTKVIWEFTKPNRMQIPDWAQKYSLEQSSSEIWLPFNIWETLV